jgi:hypothetical protein
MAGPWEKYQRGGGVMLPPAPKAQYEAPQAAADLENTRTRTAAIERGNAVEERKAGLAETQAQRARQQYPIPKEDMARINDIRGQSGGMQELVGKLKTATGAIDRFQPGPGRGTRYQNFYAEPEDGLFTGAIKGVGRMFLPDASERDYEILRAMQESAVLKTQEAQKGPQTEADAARMKASTISPTKSVQTNALLAAESIYNARMAEKKPDFYTKWANRHGSLSSLDSKGNSVDKAWSEAYSKGFRTLQNDPRYKRLIGDGGGLTGRVTDTGPSGRKQSGPAFLGFED